MQITSVLNNASYRYIPLKDWKSVVSAVNTFASGRTAGSQATTDHQMDAVAQSQGAMGLGIYLLGTAYMRDSGNEFVERLLAQAQEALKSRDSWNKSYDYDGQGVFFKTTIEIGFLDRKEEMYYLSIHAAYVGDKPEEGLAEGLGIPRALTGTFVVVEVKATGETTFAFDFDVILNALKDVIDIGEMTGQHIAESLNVDTLDETGWGHSPITLSRIDDLEVLLSLGSIENRHKRANGVVTNTWQFNGAVLSGLLKESWEEGKAYDEPTFVISVKRCYSEGRFDHKPFYLPEEKEVVLALSQRIADALEQ